MNEHIGRPSFQGEILLCEDNKMNQELICERLAKAGLKTVVAENGKEGVEMALSRIQNNTKPFDLILMDIYMPVMGGLEAAVEIGKLNTGTPIVAMTPNNEPADREQYAAHGMADCLNKPFTSPELVTCLAKYLKPASRDSVDAQDIDSLSEEKLIMKLIHSFVRNNKNKFSQITSAIDSGDIKLAHRLAHTLKGNAGMLGKIPLQKVAEEMENLLKDGENRVNPFIMGVFETELDAVLSEYSMLIAEEAALSCEGKPPAAKHEPLQVDREKARKLFEDLGICLDGGSLECLDLIGELRKIPNTGELIQQMEFFEFNAAMETLARLKEEWMEPCHE
jgi:CheY-like chemotaxis protein